MRYLFIFLLMATVGLASCLKEDAPMGPKGSNDVIEIFNDEPGLIASSTTSSYPLFVETFPISAGEAFEVFISYTGGNTGAPHDINVTVGLDDNAITTYNTENNTHYIPLPADKYTVDSWNVTIKKGEKRAKLTFTLKTDQFLFTEAYALPVKVLTSSLGTISRNFGTVLFSVGAKNQYDGVYQYTTSANTSLLPNRNVEVELWTLSKNRNIIKPGLLGNYSNVVEYEVVEATNAVLVTCVSLGVETPQDARSKYIPATRTYEVFWKQGNGARTFEEKMVFKRDR